MSEERDRDQDMGVPFGSGSRPSDRASKAVSPVPASIPNAALNVPTIAYWMGAPLGELPREELERQFCKAHERIRQLELDICDRSIAHVQDLAAMGKARLHEKRRLLRWLGVS